MKITTLSFAITTLCLPLVNGQEKTNTDPVKPTTEPKVQPKATINFFDKIFGNLKVNKGNAVISNDYFILGQTPNRYSHRLSFLQFPNKISANELAKSAMANYSKVGHVVEIAADSPKGTSGFFIIETHESRIQYSLLHYSPSADKNHVHVKQFTMRALPSKKEGVLAMMKKDREPLLKKLIALNFPKIVTEQPTQAVAKLRSVTEKVTDIQNSKKAWIINDKFAEKNGAKPIGHVPFIINFSTPKDGKMFYLTRPKVKEILRYNWVNKDKKILESLRITSMNVALDMPIEKRLQKASAFLDLVSEKLFAAQKGGKIGTRYHTKVGLYNAAASVGKIITNDGNQAYVKLVAILPTNNVKGLLAIMILHPHDDKGKALHLRLQDGLAQQALHSIRFLKSKPESKPKAK